MLTSSMIKKFFPHLGLIATLLIATPWAGASTKYFPLSSLKGTSNHQVIASPVNYQGRDALHVTVSPDHKSIEEGGCDNCTFVAVKGTKFSHGTIEIDVAGKPQVGAPDWAKGFVGVIFRADLKKDKYEGLYLRPVNAKLPDQLQRNHSTQYFSYPDHPWHKLREAAPGRYESYAPMEVGEWTRMRIDVDGTKLRLYLNHSNEAALVVNDLKLGADQKGIVGLFTEPGTDAYFSNLKVTNKEPGFMADPVIPLSVADAQTLIQPFYDLFSMQGNEKDARSAFAKDWKSYYSNTGFRDLDQTMGFVMGPWRQMLPDSRWVQDDIAVTRDNRIIVRGTLSGTPAGESFFGAPVTGKPISIMTLDMHKVVGGKIVETHHIEDWISAVNQLKE